MDFTLDTLASGRRFRTFNIVDDFTRECVAIEVDTSIDGARVVRVLERLLATRGRPAVIVCDNGPEFAGKTLDAWAYTAAVKTTSSALASPSRTATSRASTGSSGMNA